MRISLVGPCSPQDMVDAFYPEFTDIALATPGYRGIPVSELARQLVLQGHQVQVVTLDYRSDIQQLTLHGSNIQMVVHAGRPRPRHFLPDVYRHERRSMADTIKEFLPDIVHAHWTYEFALAALDTGLPCGVTAHDSPFTVVRYFKDAYRSVRLLVAIEVGRRTDNLSAVSPYLASRWQRQMRYRNPISVIPNSVPTDTVATKRKPAAVPTVISVGDSSGRKNIRKLIESFALVRSIVPDAQLRLIGPGLGSSDELHRWANDAGLAESVAFVGNLNRADLAEEYASAWLLAHPSLEETFGLTLIEALASGLPVIGGMRTGAVPYVLDQGRAGTLIDVRDPRQMADAIIESVSAAPPMLPRGAWDYVETHFSPGVVADQYLAWYTDILEKS